MSDMETPRIFRTRESNVLASNTEMFKYIGCYSNRSRSAPTFFAKTADGALSDAND